MSPHASPTLPMSHTIDAMNEWGACSPVGKQEGDRRGATSECVEQDVAFPCISGGHESWEVSYRCQLAFAVWAVLALVGGRGGVSSTEAARILGVHTPGCVRS